MNKKINETLPPKIISAIELERFPIQFRTELILRAWKENFSIIQETLKWKNLSDEQISAIAGHTIKKVKFNLMQDYLNDHIDFDKTYSMQYNLVVRLEREFEESLIESAKLINPFITGLKLRDEEINNLKIQYRKAKGGRRITEDSKLNYIKILKIISEDEDLSYEKAVKKFNKISGKKVKASSFRDYFRTRTEFRLKLELAIKEGKSEDHLLKLFSDL